MNEQEYYRTALIDINKAYNNFMRKPDTVFFPAVIKFNSDRELKKFNEWRKSFFRISQEARRRIISLNDIIKRYNEKSPKIIIRSLKRVAASTCSGVSEMMDSLSNLGVWIDVPDVVEKSAREYLYFLNYEVYFNLKDAHSCLNKLFWY